MTVRVLIVDYYGKRREHLRDFLKARFNNYDIYELATHPHQPSADLDTKKLAQIKERSYDLLIGHIGGNPPGAECLKVFKEHNPKGKAVLYTKMPEIDLDLFNDLRLADRVFKRSDNDNKLFDNADKMMEIIKEVMNRPSITLWRSPFKDPKTAATIIALFTAIISLIAALIKVSKP